MAIQLSLCLLRPPIWPEKCGLKLQVVLKWKENYIENMRVVLPMVGLKWGELLNGGVLNFLCR